MSTNGMIEVMELWNKINGMKSLQRNIFVAQMVTFQRN